MRRVALLIALICWCGCRALTVPAHDFDDKPVPAAPDYAKPSAWAALPDRADNADVVPAGEVDNQAKAAIDVFFIHPTTYFSKESWNQSLDNEKANNVTDKQVLRGQASAFNAAGRVYAPRYRQATLGTFLAEEKTNSQAALNLAYQDVVAAFDYFVEHHNKGRPIIVAGHSQGTYHAMRLLADRFAGKPLAKRLVAAYAIGYPVPADHFKRTLAPITACRSEADTGCLVSWSTWKDGAEIETPDDAELTIPYGDRRESNKGKALHCTNPLLWTTASTRGGKKDHVGAVRFKNSKPPEPDANYVEAAYCTKGALFVDLPDNRYSRLGENLHTTDYAIFYMDLRKNAVARATAFRASSKTGGD